MQARRRRPRPARLRDRRRPSRRPPGRTRGAAGRRPTRRYGPTVSSSRAVTVAPTAASDRVMGRSILGETARRSRPACPVARDDRFGGDVSAEYPTATAERATADRILPAIGRDAPVFHVKRARRRAGDRVNRADKRQLNRRMLARSGRRAAEPDVRNEVERPPMVESMLVRASRAGPEWARRSPARTRRAASARPRRWSISRPISPSPDDRVLVVDLDPQGNATSGFGIDRGGSSARSMTPSSTASTSGSDRRGPRRGRRPRPGVDRASRAPRSSSPARRHANAASRRLLETARARTTTSSSTARRRSGCSP